MSHRKDATPEKVRLFVKLLDEGWSPHVARAKANMVTSYSVLNQRLSKHPEAVAALERYRERAKLKHLGPVACQLRSIESKDE
jgi:hypothetical protein